MPKQKAEHAPKLSRAEIAERIAERDAQDRKGNIFRSTRVLLTNESTAEEALQTSRQRMFLTVLNNTKEVPKSPIAAIYITVANEPDPENLRKRVPKIIVGIALRAKPSQTHEGLGKINAILKEHELPLIEEKFSYGALRQHEDLIRNSTVFRSSEKPFRSARNVYDLPEELNPGRLHSLGLIDDTATRICRTLINQVAHEDFLSKGMEQQKLIFANRVAEIVKNGHGR